MGTQCLAGGNINLCTERVTKNEQGMSVGSQNLHNYVDIKLDLTQRKCY